MGRIPTHIVDQIYQAVDVVEVVSDYVTLKKKGANFWGLSPWSNEKTPSFSVHPGKGIYKDFSSGKGGNAVNFVMEMEGLSYVEALKQLAKRYNIEIEEEEEPEEAKLQRDKRESLMIVNEFAASYFQEQLQTDEGKAIGLSYFKERGILEHTMKTFRLGYAPDAWQGLVDAAAQQQYKEEFLLDLGLVSRSEKNQKLFDRFRSRVMFPITNPMGKVVGFGGRILGNSKEKAKYINSSESEIYHKSRVLYGLSEAKQHIRNADRCILTEGYMDTIILHQNGIQNVVASSGTALTKEQVRLIRRFTKKVLMIYDGDAAGIKAALRGIDLLIKEEMDAQVLILPDKHDPDSYVREFGPTAFQEMCEKEALSFIDFKMRVLSQDQDPNDPQVQTAIIKGIADSLALIPDRVQRQMYIRHVAQQVDITEALMMHAVDEARREVSKTQARDRRREAAMQPPEQQQAPVKALKSFEQLDLANQEKEILRIMVCHFDKSLTDETGPVEDEEGNEVEKESVDLIAYLLVEMEGLIFENQTYEQLKQQMFEEYQQHQKINLNAYLSHPDPAICNLVADLLTAPEASPLWRRVRLDIVWDGNLTKVAEGAIYHYKSRKVEKLWQECREKIKEAQQKNDVEEGDRLLEMYMHLASMRKQIHEKLGTEGAINARDGQL
ncbi:MAG: DNA primase [Bacteroidota bacterium]